MYTNLEFIPAQCKSEEEVMELTKDADGVKSMELK